MGEAPNMCTCEPGDGTNACPHEDECRERWYETQRRYYDEPRSYARASEDGELMAHAPTDLELALEVIEALRGARKSRGTAGSGEVWGGYGPSDCGWCGKFVVPEEEIPEGEDWGRHEPDCEFVALMAALDRFEAAP